jgi:hypothetical protein
VFCVTATLFVLLIPYAIWTFTWWSTWSDYLRRMAQLQNRMDEYNAAAPFFDSESSKFVSEHWWGVFRRDFLTRNDDELTRLGNKLRPHFIYSVAVGVLIIVVIGFADALFCK